MKKFFFQNQQDTNPIKFKRSIEIIYGLRNFIGNANKFAKEKIFITINSDSEFTEIVIEDDGDGFPKDILEKIDDKVKDIDKNMQLKNLVKLKIMSGDNILEVYNIPFYPPKDIYLDQVDMTDNRVIYTNELTEYKQSDPIFIQNQQLNIILQERQKLIQELEVLQNG